jgi:soluble lytic murein transglycosylase-like protein
MLDRGAGKARALVLAAVVALAAGAEAGVFRFVDEAGNVHYTNAPPDVRYRRLPGYRDDRPAPSLARRSFPRARPPLVHVDLIRETAERHRVDSRLVEAVVVVESGGNARAVSPKGAQGLMQLMPRRSTLLGVKNPFDPRENVDGGVRHLRELLQRFGNDVTLALAAYNAGEEAVRAHRGVPPYAETQEYVRRIRAIYYGVEGPGPAWALGRTPQRVFRHVGSDGTVLFTNVPPRPWSSIRRGL